VTLTLTRLQRVKGSGRGSGFANREVNRENRPTQPVRGVRVAANRIASFNAHVMKGSAATRVKCLSCSDMGTWREIVRREISRHGDEEVIWETKWRDGRAALLNPVVMLCCIRQRVLLWIQLPCQLV
jgi:hypothetical protein